MKKLFTLILTLALILGGFLGCAEKKTNVPDPVTLTMWHNYGGEMQQTMDYLIDRFNGTVGREKGIIINVVAIASSSELNKALEMILNGDPGSPDMPDIFTGYPKLAVRFHEKDMLANLDNYFTADELEKYVPAFVNEGRLDDGGLYVFPIAKSTEIIYLNRTLFDEFAESTGASIDKMATLEGIAELSEQYYEWSGKQFFAADSWFNVAEVGMAQLGDSIFDGESISIDSENYKYIFDTIYAPAIQGGIAVYDGYSSDMSKTGDIVCSTGSSAGILFYGDTITYPDGTVQQVDYNVLPYPVFENGTKTALQRGGGLMVAKTGEAKERAAAEFIKWLTSAEPNMEFVLKTGYLPVTKTAFEDEMPKSIETVDDVRIKMMLTAVHDMYGEYEFFTAPTYSAFDSDSKAYDKSFKAVMNAQREAYLAGEKVSADEALESLKLR